ncbi:MAG: VOC family protein [Micrococcales bacterium]|nr:VOC family protein [Micrococcales bacterium]
MTIKLGMVTFDTADAVALAAFWAKVVEGQVIDESDGWYVMVNSPNNVGLGFQKVMDPTPGKNKLHLDVSGENYAAEQDRLKGIGAQWVAEHKEEFGTWTVFADPDGNQFCLGDAASFPM